MRYVFYAHLTDEERKLGEVKSPAQGHSAREWWSWGSNLVDSNASVYSTELNILPCIPSPLNIM